MATRPTTGTQTALVRRSGDALARRVPRADEDVRDAAYEVIDDDYHHWSSPAGERARGGAVGALAHALPFGAAELEAALGEGKVSLYWQMEQVLAYPWFLAANRQHAHQFFLALYRACGGQNDATIYFLGNAITDTYNLDRAQHAGALVPEEPEPVRWSDIPESFVQRGRRYERQVEQLHFPYTLPESALLVTAAVVEETVPDYLLLVSYVRQTWGSLMKFPDPMIYAQYGWWCVRLAAWE